MLHVSLNSVFSALGDDSDFRSRRCPLDSLAFCVLRLARGLRRFDV